MIEQKPKKLHVIAFRVTDDQLLELRAKAEKLKVKVKDVILKKLFV